MRKQKRASTLQLDFAEGNWFAQLRTVMHELLPRMNDSGNMQGTYLISFPGLMDTYEANVLEKYHAKNLSFLENVVAEYQQTKSSTCNTLMESSVVAETSVVSEGQTLDLTDDPYNASERPDSALQQASIRTVPCASQPKPVSARATHKMKSVALPPPKQSQQYRASQGKKPSQQIFDRTDSQTQPQFTNNQSYMTNVYINLSEIGQNRDSASQLIQVQNDGRAIMLTSHPQQSSRNPKQLRPRSTNIKSQANIRAQKGPYGGSSFDNSSQS